jgi:hypothetical protein
MDDKKLLKIDLNKSILMEDAIDDKDDILSLTNAFFTNFLAQIPGLNIFTGTAKDYYQAKVTKRREAELKSFLGKINIRLNGIEMKQESIEYFENSLVFHLEEINMKLISNPGKGFDEIFAEFILNALTDLETPTEEKDLVLSSMLSIDKLDFKILKEIAVQINNNLNNNKQTGVEVFVLEDILLKEKITKLMISRSLERLQSQDLIQTLTRNTGMMSEQPTPQDLQRGTKSKQHYPSGGFMISEFGRIFLRLAGITVFP